MRNFSSLLLLLTLVASVSAQDAETFQLNGEFPGFFNESYRIKLDYDPSNALEGAFVTEGVTDSKGKFSTKFKLKNGQTFVLLISSTYYRLWAEAGKSLSLVESEKGVECSGTLGPQNQFLLNNKMAGPPARNREKFNAADHLASVDAMTKLRMEQLEKLKGVLNKEDAFLTYAHAQIVGESADRKNMGPMIAIRNKELSKSELPENYYDFWNSLPILDDSAAILSRKYQGALRAKFKYIATLELAKEGVSPVDDPVRSSRESMKALHDRWKRREASLWIGTHSQPSQLGKDADRTNQVTGHNRAK